MCLCVLATTAIIFFASLKSICVAHTRTDQRLVLRLRLRQKLKLRVSAQLSRLGAFDEFLFVYCGLFVALAFIRVIICLTVDDSR